MYSNQRGSSNQHVSYTQNVDLEARKAVTYLPQIYLPSLLRHLLLAHLASPLDSSRTTMGHTVRRVCGLRRLPRLSLTHRPRPRYCNDTFPYQLVCPWARRWQSIIWWRLHRNSFHPSRGGTKGWMVAAKYIHRLHCYW